jgi:hypothetical protein
MSGTSIRALPQRVLVWASVPGQEWELVLEKEREQELVSVLLQGQHSQQQKVWLSLLPERVPRLI